MSKPDPIYPPPGSSRDEHGNLVGPDGKPLEEDDAQA